MKEPSLIQIRLDIPDRPDEIKRFISETLVVISSHLTLNEQVERNLKLILIELTTNAIKHSTDPNASLKLTINHSQLTLEKIGLGPQIKFRGSEQMPFKNINQHLQVSLSKNMMHLIHVQEQYRFRFMGSIKDESDVQNLPENFGFDIITMASDVFEYHHDPIAQINTFLVKINT